MPAPRQRLRRLADHLGHRRLSGDVCLAWAAAEVPTWWTGEI
jgi:hypothetical protein